MEAMLQPTYLLATNKPRLVQFAHLARTTERADPMRVTSCLGTEARQGLAVGERAGKRKRCVNESINAS